MVMKQLFLWSLVIAILIPVINNHLLTHQVNNKTQIYAKANDQFQQRILQQQQVTSSIQYALNITGLKYVALLIYSLGFRIIGMENLFIWQIVYFYQQNKSQVQKVYFEIGDFINGYTNPQLFALQGFGYGELFKRLNLMWQIGFILFVFGMFCKHIIGPWYRNKIVLMMEKQKQVDQIVDNMNNEIMYTIENKIGAQQTQINLLNNHPKSNEYKSSKILQQPQVNEDIEVPLRRQRELTNIKQNNSKIKNKRYVKGNSLIRQDRQQDIKKGISNISNYDTNDDGQNIKQVRLQQNKGEQLMNKQQQLSNHHNYQSNRQKNSSNIILNSNNNTKINKSQINKYINKSQIKINKQSNINNKNKKSNKQSNLLQSNKQHHHVNHYYKKYKLLILYSNIILKQFVFKIFINSIPILCFSLIKQSYNQYNHSFSLSNLSYSSFIISISSFIIFLTVFKLVLLKQKGAGQNKSKFKSINHYNKIYWTINILQKIIYPITIASQWKYSIPFICVLKLIVFIISKISNVWVKSSDYYRNLVINFIHLLILSILTLDTFYFSTSTKVNLSISSIAFIILALLSLSFIISFIFILKDTGLFLYLQKTCKIKSNGIVNEPIYNRIFRHNNDEQQSRHVKFKSSKANSIIKTPKNTQNTIKSIKTIDHSEIKPALKSQKDNQSIATKSNIFNGKSESMVSKASTILKVKNEQSSKLYAKTSKLIVKNEDDALRAQKTHHVIYQQAKQKQDQSQDADMVSIRLQSVKRRL